MNKTDSILDELASEGALPAAGYPLRFVTPLLIVLVASGAAAASVLDGAFVGAGSAAVGSLFIKWGLSLGLVFMAPVALWTLGRPGRKSSWTVAVMALPFLLVFGMTAFDMALNAQPVPGGTWQRCLTAMAILSPLAFGGAIVAMRALAPTDLKRSGFVAGIFGGGVAMTAYAPFCPETGIAYVAVFYCLPILTMAAIGWLTGPKLLRW